MEEQKIAKIKKIRGRHRGTLTRLRNQALAIIEGNGNHTKLLNLIEESDKALRSLIEVSDEYALLIGDDASCEIERYMEEEETKHVETVMQIREYLKSRRTAGEPSSAIDHEPETETEVVQERFCNSKEAEIQAKLKELRLQQLERQLAEQRKEQELAHQRKLQEARDAAQLARMEADWRKQADGSECDHSDFGTPVEQAELHDLPSWPKALGAEAEQTNRGKTESESVSSSLHKFDQHRVLPDIDERQVEENELHSTSKPVDSGALDHSGHKATSHSRTSGHLLPNSIPRLTLPVFDGNPLEWPRWFSLFKHLIDDQPDLSNTEKMVHLQSVVQGSAKQAISGLIFDPELYPQAIDVLKARFGREQDIVQSHLDAMLSAPPPTLFGTAGMEQFCGVINNTVTVLQKLGFVGDLESYENLRRMVDRLPRELRREWGRHVVERNIDRPTLVDFNAWLGKQLKIALSCSSKGQAVRRTNLVTNTWTRECLCCGDTHDLQSCESYQQKTPDERLLFLTENRMCFGCLRRNHLARDCRTARVCGIDGCRFKHHESLHGAQVKRSESAPDREESRQGKTAHRTIATSVQDRVGAVTLLQIVPIRVHGVGGRFRDTYGLLDPGSETSLISEDLMHYLGLKGPERILRIDNVESSGVPQTSTQVTFDVSSRTASGTKELIQVPEAFGIPRINVNAHHISEEQRSSWTHLNGLDIPRCDGDIEVLLGANVVEAVLHQDVRVGRSGQPVALRTAFGWTLTGSVNGLPRGARQVMYVHNASADEESNVLLQEWWTTEAFGTKFDYTQPISQEDKRAIEIMENSTRKIGSRYETGLLWKNDGVSLPDNKGMALRRLESLERSLLQKPEKAEAYQKILNGYIEKGHARKVDQGEENRHGPRTWYLPHHAVIHPHKPGKLRVVFDAAAQFAGVSLNSYLLTGPDLLRNLTGVLLRFRQQAIAITADIEEMYHQVKVRAEDQEALRFLWRGLDLRKKPEVYQMTATIFGAKCSPASANFVLRRTGEDHAGSHQQGRAMTEAIRNNFYMDDFLYSCRNVHEAKTMQNDITRLLAKGGFRLTKWKSNSPVVLEAIHPTERAQKEINFTDESVLGCMWNTSVDTLSLRQVETSPLESKRGIVQVVARLFDPLGMALPFVLQAKLLVQRLWLRKCAWDDPLLQGEKGEWREWLSGLMIIPSLQIPRNIKLGTVADEFHELHVFCDASETAFAAVVYLRLAQENGTGECNFLMARSKVAPLRQLTVVRLELQAAVLAIRLVSTIKKELNCLNSVKTTFWSDSKVILHYIRNDEKRFHTFVANRIAEIRCSSSPEQWRYVPSGLNPADLGSRGTSAANLLKRTDWLSGPEFLKQQEASWPPNSITQQEDRDDPEVRATFLTQRDTTGGLSVLPSPERFSSWTRYRRIVAWMLRFIHNLQSRKVANRPSSSRSGNLTADEIHGAELSIVRDAQKRAFAEELAALEANKPVAPDSKLRPFSPFIDDSGVIRVGGRIDRAPVSYDVRHPVALSSDDDVTRLIIVYSHHRVLHSGMERTLTDVRRQYWIPKGRSRVKRVIHGCPVCRKRRARPTPPYMSDLPVERFDMTRAFATAGIDYFGPLLVKKNRKTEKRYGLLITCMATRAVHIEVSHALDTDSFIMALRRFIARRGKPATIMSDNGSNFIGAERELREAMAEWNQAHIQDELSQDNIIWKFLPPTASHMGGVWERLVGTVKRALKIVIGTQTLTDEVLLTALVEVEGMVNGRPLTYVSSESGDMEPLTPNHLLLGCSQVLLSPGQFQDREINSRRRWRQAQVLADQFWKRWRKEYLPTLMKRCKWLQDPANLEVGQVVLIVDDTAPRGYWPLARVTKTFPGQDGRVRSVEVQAAAGGIYQRPVTKICGLEECPCCWSGRPSRRSTTWNTPAGRPSNGT